MPEKLSRGVPPRAVTQSKEAMNALLQGKKVPKTLLPSEKEAVEDTAPGQEGELTDTDIVDIPEEREPLVIPQKSESKKVLPTSRGYLESEDIDIPFEFVESAENAFSVMFFMPIDSGLTARPKKTLDFVLNCDAVTRQKVTYVGEPTAFQNLGFSLLVLLKTG